MPVTTIATVASTREVGGATSRTFTMPTVQTGDVAVISFSAFNPTSPKLSGLGWTAQAPTAESTGGGATCSVWTKALAAADSGTTITLASSYIKCVVLCAVYRGATEIISTTVGPYSGYAAAYAPLDFTPATDKVLIQAIALGTNASIFTTSTPPSGIMVRSEQGTGGTTSTAGGVIGDMLTQNVNFSGSWSANVSAYWAGVSVELRTTAVTLSTPAVTVTYTEPSAIGASDGTITATWPAVAGAVGYTVSPPPLAGSVTTGVSTETLITARTYTWTGQSAGTQTITVQAV